MMHFALRLPFLQFAPNPIRTDYSLLLPFNTMSPLLTHDASF